MRQLLAVSVLATTASAIQSVSGNTQGKLVATGKHAKRRGGHALQVALMDSGAAFVNMSARVHRSERLEPEKEAANKEVKQAKKRADTHGPAGCEDGASFTIMDPDGEVSTTLLTGVSCSEQICHGDYDGGIYEMTCSDEGCSTGSVTVVSFEGNSLTDPVVGQIRGALIHFSNGYTWTCTRPMDVMPTHPPSPADDLPPTYTGDDHCPCVGIARLDGTVTVTMDGIPVDYPHDIGSTCRAWDDSRNIECLRADKPEWCVQKWCLVDPCKCNLPVPAKHSSYFPLATTQGHPVYYSYATCGGLDAWTSAKVDGACVSYVEEGDCIAHSECFWNAKAGCMDREVLAVCPEKAQEMGLSEEEVAETIASLNTTSSSGGGGGGGCGDSANASVANGPGGNGTVLLQGAVAEHSQSEGVKHAKLKEVVKKGANATTGLKTCECVGISGMNGSAFVTISGGDVISYPAGVGSQCYAWDENFHPACADSANAPDWCHQAWCFVDPCECGGVTTPPTVSMYEPLATYQGRSVYFSYATCGATNSWTDSAVVEENAECRQMESEAACALQGESKCKWSYSREMCVRTELFDDCQAYWSRQRVKDFEVSTSAPPSTAAPTSVPTTAPSDETPAVPEDAVAAATTIAPAADTPAAPTTAAAAVATAAPPATTGAPAAPATTAAAAVADIATTAAPAVATTAAPVAPATTAAAAVPDVATTAAPAVATTAAPVSPATTAAAAVADIATTSCDYSSTSRTSNHSRGSSCYHGDDSCTSSCDYSSTSRTSNHSRGSSCYHGDDSCTSSCDYSSTNSCGGDNTSGCSLREEEHSSKTETHAACTMRNPAGEETSCGHSAGNCSRQDWRRWSPAKVGGCLRPWTL
eukprot:TRINITY_DN4158_c0_g1_i2.p1 TRINITY_DN4158_c0_g1~~TRINITY_DN4158_c0_g1_i2.p1  ORF type:complete len:870 (-),score=240.69 TRINITY_DN4158_c0_g1_i2:2-2611(-)